MQKKAACGCQERRGDDEIDREGALFAVRAQSGTASLCLNLA